MENNEFYKKIKFYGEKINIEISEAESNKLYMYMNLMLEWNNKINLTSITDEQDIIIKHFIDSLSINKYLSKNKNVMDVGTGAGFPGIPLKILNEDIEFILVDSLNKRINFLEEVKKKLDINKLELIHSRIEDLAKDIKYREKMDIVVSRAVANLSVLSEYMLPFVRIGGFCICMKGPNIDAELENSKNALKILGGRIERVENLVLPGDLERNIIIIRKEKETSNAYPRKAGIPSKKPL